MTVAIPDAGHVRLTRIGLATLEDRGFVLAGGYALAAHGIGSRWSDDIDLFTDRRGTDFTRAADDLRLAYEHAGYTVAVVRSYAEFARLTVAGPDGPAGDPDGRPVGPISPVAAIGPDAAVGTDGPVGTVAAVDLGRDYRSEQPVRLDIGPVLDVRDAAGSKMHTMYARRAARDYLDVHTTLRSGRFSRDELIALGDAREPAPMDREMLARSLAYATRIADREFEHYGAGPDEIAELRTTMTRWAAETDVRR